MAVVTVGDMLDMAADFEERLELFYADLRDRCTQDGVKLLTYYLARHRKHLPEAYESLSGAELAAIRRMPFKYEDPGFLPSKHFKGIALPTDVKAEQVFDAAIELVDALLSFYRRLSREPLGEEAQGLFLNLVKIEERDIIELKKMKAMNYF